MMDSANTDPELRRWLRRASESGSTPMFVRTVAEAALIACSKRMAGLLLVSRRVPDVRRLTSVKRIPLPAVGQANLSAIEIDFRERQPAAEGTGTEGYGVPTIVVGLDRIISHPMIC